MSHAVRYYFAARYSQAAQLRTYRDAVEAALPDACVTSRWIDHHAGDLTTSFTPEQLAAAPDHCWEFGQADLDDLTDANVIVSFTGPGGGKGGRHVEHGIAVGLHMTALDRAANPCRLIVIGPRENIFHCHPATEVFATFDSFLAHEIGPGRHQYRPGGRG